MEGKLMPYVTKVFDRVEKVARHCIVQVSRGNAYEVQLNGDQVLVNLGNRTCTCFHWQLTGIPCVHGFACILDKRVNLDKYVDLYYTREKYLLAYKDAVQPMLGPKHWEKIQLREPHPPPVRVMPGRPKSKKRKLKRGEGAADALEPSYSQAKALKTKKRCKNCAQFGHYAKTCGNAPVQVPASSLQSKKSGKPILNNPWMIEQRRKKEERAMRKTAEGAGPSSITNKNFPQETAAAEANISSQASTTTTAPQ